MKRILAFFFVLLGSVSVLFGCTGFVVFLIAYHRGDASMHNPEHSIEYLGTGTVMAAVGYLLLFFGAKGLRAEAHDSMSNTSGLKSKGYGIICLFFGLMLLLSSGLNLFKFLMSQKSLNLPVLSSDNSGVLAAHLVCSLISIWLIYIGFKKISTPATITN